MDVSIIIVNYNTKELAKTCIKSILDNTNDIDFEIILIDNNSSDGSKVFFENYDKVKFINSNKNLGFGKANNLAYQIAKGKYIFLLNSDTIFLNNVVKIFYNKMENLSENIAFMGCLLLSADGKSYTTSHGTFPKFKDIFTELYNLYIKRFFYKNKTSNDEKKYSNKTNSFDVDYVIGADLFIRKKVIDCFGLFDPDFFMYYEETELQYRYNKLGYKSRIISGPKLIHLEPNLKNQSKKIYSTYNRYLYFEGMFVFFRKKYKIHTYLIWRILCLGYIPTIIKSKGNLAQKTNLLLLFFGIKIYKH